MAVPAICLRIIFLVEVLLVNVFVAIAANNTNLTECPVFCFLVTGNAGNGEMSPVKRKSALVVHFKRKVRFRKPVVSMAFAAIGHLAVFPELTLVKIRMTIGAFLMG